MSNPSDLDHARSAVANLKNKQREANALYKELKEAENRLALLTAGAFLVIHTGKTAHLLGASSEQKSNLSSLRFSLEEGGTVWIEILLEMGSVTVFVYPGNTTCFTVSQDDEGEANYHVHAFKTHEEAKAKQHDLNRRHR
jgi:hypothetical protein